MRRKTLLYLITATIVAVSVSSCDKEHSVYQGNNGGGIGKKLVKEAEYYYSENDYPYSYTGGAFHGRQYQWNGNKLTDIIFSEYEKGRLDEETLCGSYELIYDGNNVTEIRFRDGSYQENTYFTYNKDHITEIYNTYIDGSYSGWSRTTITYTSDGHPQEVMETYDDGSVRRYLITWSGDNIISVQRYINGSLTYTRNYTYDNKKSPYAELPEWYYYFYYSIEKAFILSANNVILASTTDNDGQVSSKSYTYAYDGDYPVKRVQTGNNSSTTAYHSTTTTYYEYADGTGSSQMPQMCIIESATNNDSWGQVRGGGAYASGSTVILYAEALSDYTFQQWSDGNTENPRTITANGNATYTAIFASNSGGGNNNAHSKRQH